MIDEDETLAKKEFKKELLFPKAEAASSSPVKHVVVVESTKSSFVDDTLPKLKQNLQYMEPSCEQCGQIFKSVRNLFIYFSLVKRGYIKIGGRPNVWNENA